jgi:predicted DNA-binding ribbon-helix-helix protein
VESRLVVSRGREEGKMGSFTNGHQVSFRMMEMFWNILKTIELYTLK